MSAHRLVLSVVQSRLFKRLIPCCAALDVSRRWRPSLTPNLHSPVVGRTDHLSSPARFSACVGSQPCAAVSPLFPFAIEQIDLRAAELAISSSHLVAEGVLTAPDQLRVNCMHTPVRYAWDQMHAYLQRSALARSVLGPLIRWQLHALRQWDQLSAQRVDHLIANSRFTARRIRKYWGREASVIYPPPPVELERFCCDADRDDVYLCRCRLVPCKRVDLVVEAFNCLGLPLLVVGDGPERGHH
ncbi:hypothetical protein [Synechococcus sp. MU1642]|uniref:hypothetical protein n=1 Tax=Synechococcus sp. MU1642 TaxID=2508348 RepID=UPI00351CF898